MRQASVGQGTPLWGALLLLTLLPSVAHGQVPAEGEPVVIAHRYSIESEILGEARPIQVALPSGYDSTQAYPVVYVMDGDDHLVHTAASADFLASHNRMPPTIVVAIGNTPGNRTRDMTPPLREPDPQYETTGGAANFQAFMRDELKPWVEARYRTRPYDVLIGHSFGGLFVAHVLNTDPGLFDAYVAISPSLWWDDEHFVSTMDDLFERFSDIRGALYMTMGNEGGRMLAGAWHLASTLEKSAPRHFRWHWRPMPSETHGSVPARSTYDGLEWTFSGWFPVDLMQELVDRGATVLPRMEEHFREVSEELGWEVKPPVTEVVNTAFQLGQRGRTDDALAIARQAAEWSPGSPYARMGVGAALAGACRWEEAEEHHRRAIDMAEEQGGQSGLTAFIRSQLDAVRAQRESGESCDSHR